MKKFAGVELKNIIREYGSPLYIYNLDGICNSLKSFQKAFKNSVEIHYATKANSNPSILREFLREGVGIDTVSWGEIEDALEVGFSPKDIIFSGVGKTAEELSGAIKAQIKQINVESPQELQRIGDIARGLKKKAQVAFRMNPDVNPKTHPYITTGFRENKFGMDSSFLSELIQITKNYSDVLDLKGLTLHVGSQLIDVSGVLEAIQKTIPVYLDLQGQGFSLETFDVGGGVGIHYDTGGEVQLEGYAQGVLDLLSPLGCRILTEPGRILVGPHGILVGEVQYIKSNPYKNFAILNTGMHHLIRPALYQAFHRIEKIEMEDSEDSDKKLYDIVGPICESSDVLGRDRYLPNLQSGDYVAICDTGAYGYSMASFYNAHRLPQEIFIKRQTVSSDGIPYLPKNWR